MAFPNQPATSYRTGRNANRFYCYGGSFSPNELIEIKIRPDSYFLCKKIHTVNYSNVASSIAPGISPQIKIHDTRLNRWFQNEFLAPSTVGGNCHSPNILPAPILFSPASVVQVHRSGIAFSNFPFVMEGEKIYDPDPAWVRKMQSRFWFQYGITGEAGAGEIRTDILDLKDPNYDFAIFRICSWAGRTIVLSNGSPWQMRIREKGPNGYYWSNTSVPNLNYSGTWANGSGPRIVTPPIIVKGTTQLEIISEFVASLAFWDVVFDGVKFPRGSRLEDWL